MICLIPTAVARTTITLESYCLFHLESFSYSSDNTQTKMLPYRTQTPIQYQLPAPGQVLCIEWPERPFSDPRTGTVAIGDPAAVLAKLNENLKWHGTQGHQPSVAEFFRDVQRYLRNEVNMQLRQLEWVINTLLEKQAAQKRVLEEAMNYTRIQTRFLQEQVKSLVIRDDPSPM